MHTQSKLEESKINGPVFVSIGDPERLRQFLENHPSVPQDSFLVDGYDFEAYRKAGFGRFDQEPETSLAGIKPKSIELGGVSGWFKFLSNFLTLAPVTPEMTFPENLTPEGLFWVGGTIVIRGDDVVYRWNDRISGDHPEVDDVIEEAKRHMQ